METATAPSPVRGLAIALLLGVVLAAAAVGFLVNVPSSLELTGASQNSLPMNQTKTTPGNQTGTSVPASSNATSGPSSPSAANSTSPSIVSVNDAAAAISGGQGAGVSNSSVSNSSLSVSPSGNVSNTVAIYSQATSTTVATAWRDLVIFAAAGALALAAFLLSRRQMS